MVRLENIQSIKFLNISLFFFKKKHLVHTCIQCGHTTDSSLLLKHKQGNIFNLSRTQAGVFFLDTSCLFRFVPINNIYSGIIVDDLVQSISLNKFISYNKLKNITIINLLTYQVIFLNSFSPELATVYFVSAAPTTE